MRAIITGGTGVIGTHLADMLAVEGFEVIVLSRNPDTKAGCIPRGVRGVRWDARTGDGWHDLIDSQTAIINLAGRNPAHWRWTDDHKRGVLESRLNAAEAVKDALRRAKSAPCALLQASAVGYYGDRGDEVLTETSTPGVGWRADVCKVWEASVAGLGVRTAILRIGIVLANEGGAFPPFKLAGYIGGRKIGSGKQYIPWIHNHDVARAIRHLMLDDQLDGAYNLCAHPVTNRELMATVSRITGIPAVFPAPTWALKLVMGEQAETVLDSQRVLPARLDAAGFTFRYSHIEAALRGLM
jgi:uncharacterized protein